jgi:hypothetical protein
MDAEVVQRFEEPAVIPAFVAPARAHRPEHLIPSPGDQNL